MKHIFYIWAEEFYGIFHDKGVLIFIVFVPLAYPLLYSYVYTNEVVRDVPFVAVDECNSAQSREFLRHLDGTPDARLLCRAQNTEEAHQLMKERKAYGIVQIPRRFDEDIYRGDQTCVALYSDMSSLLYYKALLLACTDVSLDMNKQIKVEHYLKPATRKDEKISSMPIEYEHIKLYNPQSGFASFLIPPVLMLIIQQTLLLGIGMQMGDTRERNRGWIFPINHHYKDPVQIVAAKTMVYFPLYLLMAFYMFGVVNNIFGLIELGRFTTLLAFTVPYLLDCIFFAMMMSLFVYRREDCILIFVFLSVPMLFLSGVSWPYSAMPAFWKYVSYLFPSTFGINGYVRIMDMGCSLHDIRTEYCGILIQLLVYMIVTTIIYAREILHKSRLLA